MSNLYWHSVSLEPNLCNGCTCCLHKCPTQAIRVKDGKARIIAERCVDCGECLKACPYHAKGALSDTLEVLKNYKVKVALPAIALYGQFPLDYDMNRVFNGFFQLGFDYVYDVSQVADFISDYQLEYIKNMPKTLKPAISATCPAVLRLILIKYPTLIDHIIRLESPEEVAARLAREQIMKITGLPSQDIGIFYIAQCPATITAMKVPIGTDKSDIDCAIALEDVYASLLRAYSDNIIREQIPMGTGRGIGWGICGGQSYAMGLENYIAVDGIDEVVKVLDKLELGKLHDIDFFEAYACVTGCVGGPLNVENAFVGKNRIRQRSARMANQPALPPPENIGNLVEWHHHQLEPNPVLRLDQDMKQAIIKMTKIEEACRQLPGIDCGACGAPTCRAYAEDKILGFVAMKACPVLFANMAGNHLEKLEVEKTETEA